MALQNYARASIEFQGSDIGFMTDMSGSEKNGAKIEGSFRKNGNGVSFGFVEVELKITVKISTTKQAVKWRSLVRDKTIVEALTLKYPDGTRDTLDGAFSSRAFKQALEGACEFDMDFVGTAGPASDD